jgi:excisionase family DNA binding protein
MLLKTKEAARELAVAPKTVIKLIKAGKLKGVRVGNMWRVDVTDLSVFVAKRKT